MNSNSEISDLCNETFVPIILEKFRTIFEVARKHGKDRELFDEILFPLVATCEKLGLMERAKVGNKVQYKIVKDDLCNIDLTSGLADGKEIGDYLEPFCQYTERENPSNELCLNRMAADMPEEVKGYVQETLDIIYTNIVFKYHEGDLEKYSKLLHKALRKLDWQMSCN